MAKQLKDLTVVEVSLVPRGANKKTFMLIKSEDGEDMVLNISKELILSLSKSLGDESKILELLEKSKLPKSASEYLLGAIRLINSASAELPEDSREEILSKIFTLTGIGEKSMTVKKEDEVADNAHETPAPKPDPSAVKAEEVSKELKGKVETLEKALESSDKRFKEAMEALQKEREERKTKEFVSKAESLVSNLGVEKEKLGLALKAVSENCPAEVYATLEQVLSAANKAVEKSGLFSEVGSSQAGSQNLEEQITKIAKEIEISEKVSPTVAESLAWQRNPKLYAKYLKDGSI